MIDTIIDGKYQILSKVGSGGTSVVYKARRLSDNSIVAIKILREEYANIAEHERRFRHEVDALSKMTHRNIRKILGVGQFNGALYMATEFVDGESLKYIVTENGALPITKVLDYALQITSGLEHAHNKNIIHRDIKPQNILISGDGVAKIVDFGIARVLSQSTITMGGKDVVGSVHYISPEQAKGLHVDMRSDIYSFGVLLYEISTGQLPFTGTEAVTVAMKQIEQKPVNPMEICHDIPKGLSEIILKCMEKDPEDRYQSASELHADLVMLSADPLNFTLGTTARKIETVAVAPETPNDEDVDVVPQRKKRADVLEHKRLARKRNKKLTVLIAAIFAGLCVAVALIFILIPNGSGAQSDFSTLKMPSVTDMTDEAARAILRQNGIANITSVNEYNKNVDKGKIASQVPDAETEVKVNTSVTLVVSMGPKPCPVPAVLNTSEAFARAAIENADLVCSVEYKYTDEHPEDIVLSQSILSGTVVDEGTTISVVVTKPIQVVNLIAPDLTGKTRAEAEEIIVQCGFRVGTVYSEYSSLYPAGVYKQSLEQGKVYTYKQGEDAPFITINISKGPYPYRGEATFDLPEDVDSSELLTVKFQDSSNKVTEKAVHATGTVTVSFETEISGEMVVCSIFREDAALPFDQKIIFCEISVLNE